MSKRKREALDKWLSIVIQSDVRINGPILKDKAEDFQKNLVITVSKATDGWLSRWKVKHNIIFKKVNSEKGSADNVSAEEWKSNKTAAFLESFKGIRMDALPVDYHANKNAWMTSDIFQNYLMSWDKSLQREKRKILLLVDNCSAYPNLDSLKIYH